jgi:membrane protein YdbS with pleckstrin-like domain
MPLPRKLLNEDEELLAELQPHWLFFAGPLLAAVGAWVVILALLIGVKGIPDWTSYPLLILGAVPTVWLAARLLRWRTTTLALTTTRILLRRGILGRDTIQLRLQRITEINLAQTLFERIFGTGRLVIDVQGEDDSLILTDVRKPAVVQRVVNAQINELVGGGSREEVPSELRPRDYQGTDARPVAVRPPESATPEAHREDTPPFGTSPVAMVEPTDPSTPAPTPGFADGGIHEKLIELDDLRRRGILSEEEFAAKKAELLGRF